MELNTVRIPGINMKAHIEKSREPGDGIEVRLEAELNTTYCGRHYIIYPKTDLIYPIDRDDVYSDDICPECRENFLAEESGKCKAGIPEREPAADGFQFLLPLVFE